MKEPNWEYVDIAAARAGFEEILAERVTLAVASAQREVARSVMLCDVSAARRESGHITSCAWCRRFNAGGGWYAADASRALSLLIRVRPLTHGVCPACFARIAPAGLDYPDEPSPDGH